MSCWFFTFHPWLMSRSFFKFRPWVADSYVPSSSYCSVYDFMSCIPHFLIFRPWVAHFFGTSPFRSLLWCWCSLCSVVRQLLQSATPPSLRNLPNSRQGHPWLHLPPSPTGYQNRIKQCSTRCNLFNYRHRLTKMHKAVEAWKQKKIHK